MVLLYITLQCVGFVLALFFASIGYGRAFDLSDYHSIFNEIIFVCLLTPFIICLLLFRMEFLREIFKKEPEKNRVR